MVVRMCIYLMGTSIRLKMSMINNMPQPTNQNITQEYKDVNLNNINELHYVNYINYENTNIWYIICHQYIRKLI